MIQGGSRYLNVEIEFPTNASDERGKELPSSFDRSAIYKLPQLYWNRMSNLMPAKGASEVVTEDVGWDQWPESEVTVSTPTDHAAATEAFIQFILNSSQM